MTDTQLIRAAAEAAVHAHCPYSGLKVGAALLAQDGRVFTGVNVENASYGLTLCAERSAVSAAITAGVTAFDAIAIVADSEDRVPPCGACRQVLAEFCTPELRILLAPLSARKPSAEFTLAQLLPQAFKLNPPKGDRRQ